MLFVGCNDNTELKKPAYIKSQATNEKIDSLKWLFYAYACNDSALFFKNQKRYKFKPIECDIKVDTILFEGDSTKVVLSFFKEGYRYSHLYHGLELQGFIYFEDMIKPLTGNVTFESLNNFDFLKKYNAKTDSIFRIYLKTIDASKISKWLFKEAKKRNIL